MYKKRRTETDIIQTTPLNSVYLSIKSKNIKKKIYTTIKHN